ncbi:MAG: ammonia channel protein, partial [Bacteroidota bacterium]
WGLDDTLDAFSVHGIGGIFGALATGIFATTSVNPDGADGLLHGNVGLLGIQALAVVATILFSGGVTWVLITLIRGTFGIRSEKEHEYEGLDFVEHGERAYHEIV